MAYGDRPRQHRLAQRPGGGWRFLDKTRFVEHSRSGYATVFTVTACEPFCFWAFTMENGNMSGSWEETFEAAEGGARLTCTETVTAKRRWMRPFVPGYLKRQQKLYLDDLQRELQREAHLMLIQRRALSK